MPSEARTRQILQEELGRLIPTGVGVVSNAGIGRTFYVNNAASNESDTTGGLSWASPLATIDAAIGLCVAGRGDRIMVGPGHAETIATATAIAIDIAGITIEGVGNGALKPTITYATAATALTTTISVTAANVTIKNIKFKVTATASMSDVTSMLTISENHCTVEDCDFEGNSTFQFLNAIAITTTYDFVTIRRCRFIQDTDPAGTDGGAATGGIYLVDSEHVLVQDCQFIGNFETACIHNKTTACKYLVVERCYMYCALAGSEPFQLVAAAIGCCKETFVHTPAEAAATEATLFGTLGDAFFIAASSSGGNDGAAGGQGGIVATAAS